MGNKKQQSTVDIINIDEKVQNVNKYKKKEVFSFISNQNLAIICCLVCGVFWVCGFVYANQQKISAIQVNYGRYYVQIISTIVIMIFNKDSFLLKDERDLKILLIRSLISGINGIFQAIFQLYISLPVLYTLSGSVIIYTFLINYFLYKIQVTSNQIKAVFFAAIGILFTVNGRYFYSLIDSDYHFQSKFDYSSSSMTVFIFVCLLVLLWTVAWGYGIIITSKHHSSLNQFIFINSLIGFAITSVFQMMISDQPEQQVSSSFLRRPELFWNMMLYSAVPMAVANYIFNLGFYIIDNSSIGSVVCQINIVYAYLISVIRYDEEINLFCILGSIILVVSIYIVLVHK